MTKNPSSDATLPKASIEAGSCRISRWVTCGDSIVMDEAIKNSCCQSDRQLHGAPQGGAHGTPLHGVILLVGPPGTGKTSLARGLAHRVARIFSSAKFRLLEVEPHADELCNGKDSTRRGRPVLAIDRRICSGGPTIVLLDEVETLAADRAKLSLEANPVDVHRATDAVLVQLDMLAERNPHLLFVATSNFPQAVDSAFLSRCDMVMEVPLPGRMPAKQILVDCLNGLAKTFRGLASFPRLTSSTRALASASDWMVGAIRRS